MTAVRPWRLGDTQRVRLQPSQHYMAELGDLSIDLTPLSEQGLAWTVENDGGVIACGGLIPVWEGRANAWMLIGEDAGENIVPLYRAIREQIRKAPFRRVEAFVDVGFTAGIRMMKMLGFELESYKRAYRPDGADMLEFVRIRI